MLHKILLILLLSITSTKLFAQNTYNYKDIEQHFRNGLEFYERKNYTSARQEFKNYIDASKSQLLKNEYNVVSAEYFVVVSGLYEQSPDAEIEVERFVVNHGDHPKAQEIYADLGTYFFDRGEFQKAISYLEKGYEYNANLDLAYKLGLAYFQLKNKTKALGYFNAVKRSQNPNASSAGYYAGTIAFENGNLDEALNDFLKIENTPAYRNEIPNWITNIYFKQKAFDKLIAYTEPILNNPQGRKIDEMSLLTAEVAYMNGNYAKAAQFYEKAKSFRMINDPESWFRFGYAQFSTEKFGPSIENFKKVAAEKTKTGQQAAYYLGVASQKTNNIQTALSAFETAKIQNFVPEIKEDAAFNSCKLLLQSGNSARGVSELLSFIKDYPASSYHDEANELLVDAYLGSSDYALAAKYIELLPKKSTKIESAYQRVCFNKAILDFNTEQYASAIAYFSKAISHGNDLAVKNTAKFWLAESYFANKQTTEATNTFEDVAATANDDLKHKSKYALGYIAFNDKNYPKAIQIFDDFASNVPRQESFRATYDDANLRIGDAYLIQKNFEKAMFYYNRVIEKGANEKDYALYQKGMSYVFMGKTTEAKQVFDEMPRQYPNSRYADDAWYQSGVLELEKGSYQPAINLFTRVISNKIKSNFLASALLKRAVAYSNVKNHEASIKDYKRILIEFPTSTEIDNTMIGIQDELNAVNRPEEFTQILEDFKNKNPENGSIGDLAFDSAKNMYLSEKYQQAINAFQSYIRNYPQTTQSADARFYIADSYYRLNDKPNALRNFNQVLAENKSAFTPRAAYRIGEIEFEAKNYKNAIQAYRLVATTAQSKKDIAVAWSALMESYFVTNMYDSTVYFAKEIINGGNVINGAQNKAQLYLGKASAAKGDVLSAETEFRKLLNANDANGAEALYSIGELQYKAKKYDESIKTLQGFNKSYSNYAKWFESAFVLIADNYIAKEDYFMAKATLNSVIENAELAETKALAKEKLKAIESKN